jgi:hypothetical protein
MSDIIVSKQDQTLISKCCQAVKNRDYSGLTREDCDRAIESVAKAIARDGSVSMESTYQVLQEDDLGKVLYQAREECPALGTGGPVEKFELSNAERQEKAARQFAERYNVSLEEARTEVAAYFQD